MRTAAPGSGNREGAAPRRITDTALRGRDRIALEVDAVSPTGADGLYRSMGWATDYALESWFKDLDLAG